MPSEEIVRHAINVYLATFNSGMPLFDPRSLLQVVDDWYGLSPDRLRTQDEKSSWATINVALALAHCHGAGNLHLAASQTISVSRCLENAQSTLGNILDEDANLQHIQVLLGLGILFLGSRPDDVRAAMMFTSTGVRLAQAMGMHRMNRYDGDSHYMAADEMAQRKRVFWIAYVLDRDVAARMKQAPILQDADIDLDLPADDDAGTIHLSRPVDSTMDAYVTGSDIRFNLFRARVELARIQGRVYECALSVRASTMDPGESGRLAQSIRLSLQQWKARLPGALGVEILSLLSQSDLVEIDGGGVPYLPAFMSYLHSLIIMCLGQLCRVNSMEYHWIDKVLSYARGISNERITEDSPIRPYLPPTSFPSDIIPVAPPSPPPGWNVLVSECRDFMLLFQSVRVKHPTFVNVQLCSFASSLLCLAINAFLNFEDRNLLKDRPLMAGAAVVLAEVRDQTKMAAVSRVLEVYKELDWHLELLTSGAG